MTTCANSSISNSVSDSRPLCRNLEEFQGGIVTPLPMWRHAAHSVISFDGGTRCSVHLEKLADFCHFQRGVLAALDAHKKTRQPVELLPGVLVRGASSDEVAYFRDYPQEGALVLVSDSWRVIIRADFFQTRLNAPLSAQISPSDNTGVIIFGWRAFAQNSSVSGAFASIVDFLRACGMHCTLDRINRADINQTRSDVPMAAFLAAFREGCLMSRSACRLVENRPGSLGTLYIGGKSSPVMMRAYDKSAELRASLKSSDGRDKLRALRQVFDDDELTHLTRIEFELHRQILQDFAIETFDDLEKKLLALLQYLTGKWLRVLQEPRNKQSADRHAARLKIAPWWSDFAAKFADFAQCLQSEQIHATRCKHVRTTGGRSFARALSWLKIAALECLATQQQDLDIVGRDAIIEDIGARLVMALKLAPQAVDGQRWGSGADVAWQYALDNLED